MSAQTHSPVPIVSMRGIEKTFPGVVANRGVNFDLLSGEVHALVGENGAGKSTLMKILFGLYTADAGHIEVRGGRVSIANPEQAIALRVGMVHQHFMLVSSLSVAENLVLGMEPRSGPFLDLQAALRLTEQLASQYGLRVPARARVRDLSVGERQRVEILKALARGAEILILDEPTAVLTPQETDELFSVLRSLVRNGMSVVLITHKLREVLASSDRVTVMRAGRTVGTVRTQDTSTDELARMMVGRDVLLRIDKQPATPGEVVLAVNDLVVEDDLGLPAVRGASFSVRSGEIYGLAGVEGNGQSELIQAITGLRGVVGGSVALAGTDIEKLTTRERRELGLSHIPEDRIAFGTSPASSVADNAVMGSHYRPPLARRFWLSARRLRERAHELISRFDVRGAQPKTPLGALSGGNMQKLVVARELSRGPRLLVAAQPTRGVDIGAIEFIHRKIIEHRDQGAAVLLVSAELSEVLSLADRVGVIYEGRVVAEFDGERATETEIGVYMLGAQAAGPQSA